MIKNRLNFLMVERGLTIKDVHEKTNLSRTTISNLMNNISDGVQSKTLNTLCNFLKITPSDFFEYSPLDVDLKFEIVENSVLLTLILLEYDKKIGVIQYKSDFDFKTSEDFAILENEKITGEAQLYLFFELCSDSNDALSKIKKLSISMQTKVKEDIIDFTIKESGKALKNKYPSFKNVKNIKKFILVDPRFF